MTSSQLNFYANQVLEVLQEIHHHISSPSPLPITLSLHRLATACDDGLELLDYFYY